MCGICGIIIHNEKEVGHRKIMARLLEESEIRGSDATGVCWIEEIKKRNEPIVLKGPKKSTEFVADKKIIDSISRSNSSIMIGHTRARTKGDEKNNDNNHPLVHEDGLLLVHNGALYNDDEVFKEYGMKRKAEVDSEVIIDLIATLKTAEKLTTIEAIQKMAGIVRGSMACALIDRKEKNALYLWASTSPLTIAYDKRNKNIYFASTQMILEKALEEKRTFLSYFTESKEPEEIIYKIVPDDTGIKIKNGKITEYKLTRPTYAVTYPSDKNDDSRTRYCYTCYKSHGKPHKCGHTVFDSIKKPSEYSTDQLERRWEYLDRLSTTTGVTDSEANELKRIDLMLSIRYKTENAN